MEDNGYLDLLPLELLASITPSNYIYGYLEIFDEPKRYQIFKQYVQLAYPDYYWIYSAGNSSYSYESVIKMLYNYVITEEINDFKPKISAIEDTILERDGMFHFHTIKPLFLIEEYPKLVKYLRENKNYINKIIEEMGLRNSLYFYEDIITNLVKFFYDQTVNMLYWEIPDELKIKIIELSDIPVNNLHISGDDLDRLFDSKFMQYLIKRGIKVV